MRALFKHLYSGTFGYNGSATQRKLESYCMSMWWPCEVENCTISCWSNSVALTSNAKSQCALTLVSVHSFKWTLKRASSLTDANTYFRGVSCQDLFIC